MGKTRYKTKFGNLNASGIIDRLKIEKSVKYSRKYQSDHDAVQYPFLHHEV